MIKSFKFTRWEHGDWFHGPKSTDICLGTLRQWVDIPERALTIHLCFSDKPKSKTYAYEYSFLRRGSLSVHTDTDELHIPFLCDVDKLFYKAARQGVIPRKGWGWVETE